MRVQSLGREDPLEKEMATYSDSLPWKMPWTEEPHELQSMGSQRVGHDCARTCTLSDPTAHSPLCPQGVHSQDTQPTKGGGAL